SSARPEAVSREARLAPVGTILRRRATRPRGCDPRGADPLTLRWVSTMGRVGPGQIPEAALVGALWSYAAGVLYPARMLKRAGASVVGPPVGDLPERLPQPGLGRHFADGSGPVMLTEPNRNADLVEDFDRLAELYEALVRPFSTPIFDEALEVLGDYLASDSRVLDVGCGPGHELRQVAARVPRGEVIGVDLAAGMVEVADASAR